MLRSGCQVVLLQLLRHILGSSKHQHRCSFPLYRSWLGWPFYPRFLPTMAPAPPIEPLGSSGTSGGSSSTAGLPLPYAQAVIPLPKKERLVPNR